MALRGVSNSWSIFAKFHSRLFFAVCFFSNAVFKSYILINFWTLFLEKYWQISLFSSFYLVGSECFLDTRSYCDALVS